MPRFTLDLRWTKEGRENVANGRFLITRREAQALAARLNLTVTVTDRPPTGEPDPQLGPIWVVEGQEEAVNTLIKKFNDEKHVHVETVRRE